MSFSGAGVFNINSTGQPVVAGTTISSSTFNALTADLATGLSTCITKDGQQTVTANIPFANYRLTAVGAGTAATDAANVGQVQSRVSGLITVTGTDTLVGTMSPTLGAYATGSQFAFVAANTNTTTVTLNIDGLGAKAVTRDGSTALVAGDITANKAHLVVYDGTRFQLLNSPSFTDLKATTLAVSGATTLSSNVTATATSGTALTVTGVAGNAVISLNGAALSCSSNYVTGVYHTWQYNGTSLGDIGTANNTYSGGSTSDFGVTSRGGNLVLGTGATERARIDTSGNLLMGGTSLILSEKISVQTNANSAQYILVRNINAGASAASAIALNASGNSWGIECGSSAKNSNSLTFVLDYGGTNSEKMRLDTSGNLGIGTTSISNRITISDLGTGIGFVNAASGNFNLGLLGGTSSAIAYIYQRANAALLFGTNNTEVARFDSSGNFGIGGAPLSKLHVYGTAAGTAALRLDTTATTGAQTATWTAPTNKPGAASGVVTKWIPVNLDGTTYYIPAWT